MATVNRHSLREEFDALEVQFEALCAEGKVNADSRALFQVLFLSSSRGITPEIGRTVP